jgi:hypothetical protein
MRGLADPDLLRFMRMMCGTLIQEYNLKETEGLWEVIDQKELGRLVREVREKRGGDFGNI